MTAVSNKVAFERKRISFPDSGRGGAADWFTPVTFPEHYSQVQSDLQCADETWCILG